MTARVATGAVVLADIPKRIREHFSRRHRKVMAVGSKRRLPGNTELDPALARDSAVDLATWRAEEGAGLAAGAGAAPSGRPSPEPGEERPPTLDGLLVQAVAAHQQAADLLRWERLRKAAFPGALAEAFERAREVRLGFSLAFLAPDPAPSCLTGRRP